MWGDYRSSLSFPNKSPGECKAFDLQANSDLAFSNSTMLIEMIAFDYKCLTRRLC